MERSFCVLALAAAMVLGGSGYAADAPSPGDPRQLFDSGKFPEVVKAVSSIVHSREWPTKKAQAYELYTLKAEAHLRMKETALALATFEMAAKAAMDDAAADKAAIDKTTTDAADDAAMGKWAADRAHAGTARATIYLIKHSIGTNYVAKPTSDKPEDHVKIDIIEPESRKAAMEKIWTDARKAAEPAVVAATAENTTLPALLSVIPGLGLLRDLDFGAHGNDSDTRKIDGQIAGRAKEILTQSLDPMSKRLADIYSGAMEFNWSRQGTGNGYIEKWRHHGLEGKEPAELQEMVAKTAKTAGVLKLFVEGLPTEKEQFDKAFKDAKRIHETATKLLKTNYSITYPTKEAAMGE